MLKIRRHSLFLAILLFAAVAAACGTGDAPTTVDGDGFGDDPGPSFDDPATGVDGSGLDDDFSNPPGGELDMFP